MVGTTLDGTFNVNVFVVEPIEVEPEYVVTLTVQVPLHAVGPWLAKETGGVKDMLVDVDCVVTVVVELPNVYWTVWVNDELALEIVTVCEEPIPNDDDESVNDEVRGIVSSVIFPLPLPFLVV